MDKDGCNVRRWRHAVGRRVRRDPAIATLAVCIVGAAVLGGAPAPATGHGWVVRTTRAASDAIPGVFEAATATSAHDVWAVGHTAGGNGQTLIAHWNGAAWATVPSPSPGSFASLAGVAATATSDAWAVGSVSLSPVGSASPNQQALILHWDGGRWTQVAVPALGSVAGLRAVAATSTSNAWAVGSYSGTAGSRALILRWDGSAWTQMPGPAGELGGVAASSPSNAWAVGSTPKGRTLILHWNGRVWSRVPSPSPRPGLGLTDFLNSVAIGPGNAAWAVGTITCGCGPGISLIERWNGRSWRVVPSPTRGSPDLASVISISARDAWAVGASGSGDGPEKTAILHWDGRAWKRVASPSPDPSASLAALTLVSPRDIWAVGSGSDRKRTRLTTVVLHWNGRKWG